MIQRLLDRLDIRHLQLNLRRRGWVAVPRVYAESAYPESVKTGWWPIHPTEIED